MSRIGKKPVELPSVLAHLCPVRPSKSKAQREHAALQRLTM